MQHKNKIKQCKNIQARVIPTDAKQRKWDLNSSILTWQYNIMNLGGGELLFISIIKTIALL